MFLLLADDTPITLDLDGVLSPYVGVFVASFMIAFVATPLMRRLALATGAVDQPDRRRKHHGEPVAYLGGLAIFLGWVAGVVVSRFTDTHLTSVWPKVGLPFTVLVGAVVITATGVIDDLFKLSPRVKVGGQLFAAAALTASQVGVRLVGASLETLGWAGAPPWLVYVLGTAVVVVFVVGGCNAMNLLDGLDGLAAGVGVVSAAGFLFIAVWVAMYMAPLTPDATINPIGDPIRIVMALAILGALLGFLPYNFNPANIFMGDAGSMLTGYLCVTTILIFADTNGKGPMFVMAALIVFALPIADTSLAIVRRKLAGEPLLQPDNKHLHHQLLRAARNLKLGPDLSVKVTVVAMYMLAGVFAVLGCSLIFLRWRYVLSVFMVLFATILAMAYKSGRQYALQSHHGAEDAAATAPPAAPPRPPRDAATAKPAIHADTST
jgi:UDP-GlcNAc:undecaprenyl-phosphate/decaprenyl-phosphate GlcNAc-1-phosphate transferase